MNDDDNMILNILNSSGTNGEINLYFLVCTSIAVNSE